jgi:hypothetical protein
MVRIIIFYRILRIFLTRGYKLQQYKNKKAYCMSYFHNNFILNLLIPLLDMILQRYKKHFIPPNNLSNIIEKSGYSNAF